MARKAEGRIISTDEYDFLAAFNDRLERRSVRRQQEKFEKYQKRHKEAFDSIPKGAFEMGIDGTGLTLNLQEALVEAGFDNAGKLVLASIMNPDSLLEISGIGPKTMERIAEFAEELPNLVPQIEEEIIEEPVAEEDIQSTETAVSIEQDLVPQEVETVEEPVMLQSEAIVEVGEEQKTEESDVQSEPEKELSFDEMFSLKPEVFEPILDSDDESDDTENSGQKITKKKKKNKKAGRFRTLEYDPDKDVTVAKKKHKRGDGESWEEI
jgi:N utilization substance protein A